MKDFWNGKRVFLTGHTGFKGSWLSMWLSMLGAQVKGYALEPPTEPSLFELCKVKELLVQSVIKDIRDLDSLKREMVDFQPEIVIHMAAQPLVRESYSIPVDTYSINVMGTVNLFEAVRVTKSVKSVVNVTTDKCYENKEWVWGYREGETLGGYDPYSSSKACAELVTDAYRNSYFPAEYYDLHGVAIATVRAGNVIGGGDWAKDRLIPDCMQSLILGEPIHIRNPHSIRPWQHVLEPLSGYLMIAQRLFEDGTAYEGAWNFGPNDQDTRSVEWIVQNLCDKWKGSQGYVVEQGDHPHEAAFLKLDCSKSRMKLGWSPRWELGEALDYIIEWTEAFKNGEGLSAVCFNQISRYEGF
ncbi:CDP-glucose 4,6-dehydratase [Paenibacillus uliginis N3/975]|uniref:CDP-glucose 4,6-dehydratase n=1 Tax=Paenibacillus uliginis N3/975 TaxID=1313296 RepID=A0A1X7GDU3_9BACL|nr:CDP-glucose 4,6-dehydratase [Paenibacillus uliginis]SMF67558.1 CDP-glucose 4,6-dehydratase [Paenibacillus uliginis N3/975]